VVVIIRESVLVFGDLVIARGISNACCCN